MLKVNLAVGWAMIAIAVGEVNGFNKDRIAE